MSNQNQDVAVTRVANACVLLEMDGHSILTDPWFTERWYLRRGEPLGLDVTRLAPLTAIVATSFAANHWDLRALREYRHSIACKRPVNTRRGARLDMNRASGFTIPVVIFTDYELAYLKSQGLGRLATIGPDGPQVNPLGFSLNDDGTIDIGGPALSKSQKWRNIAANPAVSFVVDDLTPNEPGEVKPGWGRGVEIRGRAELLTDQPPPAYGGSWFSNELIRIHPRRILSWHLDAEQLQYRRDVA